MVGILDQLQPQGLNQNLLNAGIRILEAQAQGDEPLLAIGRGAQTFNQFPQQQQAAQRAAQLEQLKIQEGQGRLATPGFQNIPGVGLIRTPSPQEAIAGLLGNQQPSGQQLGGQLPIGQQPQLQGALPGGLSQLIAPADTSKTDFKKAREARKEFTDLSKDFFKQRDAFGRIQASATNPSAAGDLALIFNFMKVLDPGSTVREGEFATAESSGSVPARTIALYNKVLRGERLAPEQRADFLSRGEALFGSANAQHAVRIQAFTGLSERFGIDPQNVVLDLGLAEQEAVKEGTAIESTFTADEVRAEIKRRGL